MWPFAARRLASLVPVWLGISILAFGLSALIPGDPAAVLLQRQTGEMPSDEAVSRLRQEMGLEEPLPVRYGRWLARALRGDLGRSYRTDEAVAWSQRRLGSGWPRPAFIRPYRS